jgi:hypothetical protein
MRFTNQLHTNIFRTVMKVTIVQALTFLGAAQAQNQTRGAAMMRFACSQLTVERLDPLVNPGLEGSPHTHQIVGGNSFQAEMKPEDHDLVAKSTCTTCTFSEDFRYVQSKELTTKATIKHTSFLIENLLT